jgi:type IV secretion system protein TrbL
MSSTGAGAAAEPSSSGGGEGGAAGGGGSAAGGAAGGGGSAAGGAAPALVGPSNMYAARTADVMLLAGAHAWRQSGLAWMAPLGGSEGSVRDAHAALMVRGDASVRHPQSSRRSAAFKSPPE